MALEQRIEHLCHTSGSGYEKIELPSAVLRRPYEFTLEPDQHPFLLEGTQLRGESSLVTNPEPFRVGNVRLPQTVETRGFKRITRKTEPIPVYSSVEQALYELLPRNIPLQRENSKRLFESLTDHTGTIRFTGGNYSGTLSFLEGNLVAAITRTGHEELRGKSSVAAFLLLNSYQPLTFSQGPLDDNSPDYVGAGLNAIHASTLPALAYTLRESVGRRTLGNHIFNISGDGDVVERAGNPDYCVGIRFDGTPVGILRFRNNNYLDGQIRSKPEAVTGDDALLHALTLAVSPNVTYERLDRSDLLARPLVGKRARQTAVATAAQYLAAAHF